MAIRDMSEYLEKVTEYHNLSHTNQKKMLEFVNNISRSQPVCFEYLYEKTIKSMMLLSRLTNGYQDINDETLLAFLQNREVDGIWLFRYILMLSKGEIEQELLDSSDSMKKGYSAQLKLIRENESECKKVIKLLNQNYDLTKTIQKLRSPPSWNDVIFRTSVAMEGSAKKGQLKGKSWENIIAKILDEFNIPYEREVNPVYFDNTQEYKIEKKIDFCIPTCENPYILIEAKMHDSSGGSKQSDALGDLEKILSITSKLEKPPLVYFGIDGRQWRNRLNDLAKFFLYQQRRSIEGVFQQKNLRKVIQDLVEKKLGITEKQSSLSQFWN